MAEIPKSSRTSFAEFVAEQEAAMSEDERADLDAWRAHFRGDDEAAGGVPAGGSPLSPAPSTSRVAGDA